MDQAIIHRETICQRGRDAFTAGRTRDSHNMNPGATALEDWLAGFDQAARAWNRQLRQQALVITPEAA